MICEDCKKKSIRGTGINKNCFKCGIIFLGNINCANVCPDCSDDTYICQQWGKKVLVEEKIADKPPLGITPKYIFEEMRVKDICRALYDYSLRYTTLNQIEYMIKWAEELVDRLYTMKYDREEKEGK